MSGLALPFVLLDCRLPFPTWSKSSVQLGRVMALPGRCPEAQGLLMTLHYGKAVITFHSLAPSLITQGTPEGRGRGDDSLPGYPVPLLTLEVVVATDEKERSGQEQAAPLGQQ